MKSKWSYVVALGLLALPGFAAAQSRSSYQSYLDVKGHAERFVQPDRFVVKILVEVSDKKPALARTRVEKYMADVLGGFTAHHALRETVSASALSIQPKSEYRGDTEVVTGTQVSRTATATFASVDDLRAFIDGLDASNELQITGTETTRSDIAEIRAELLTEAAKASQRSVAVLAKAYGVTVGPLFTVSEHPTSGGYSASSLDSVVVSANRKGSLPSVDLQVGGFMVVQDIYATYLLESPK